MMGGFSKSLLTEQWREQRTKPKGTSRIQFASDNTYYVLLSFALKVGLFADFWGKRHFCLKNHFD